MFKLKNNYSLSNEIFPDNRYELFEKIEEFYQEENYIELIAYGLEFLKRYPETNDKFYIEGWIWQPLALAFKRLGETESTNIALTKAIEYYKVSLESNPDYNDSFKQAAAYALVKDINASKKPLEIAFLNNSEFALKAYFEPSFEEYKNNQDWIDFLFGLENRLERIKILAQKQKESYGYDEDKFNIGLKFILKESEILPPQYNNYNESNLYAFFIGFLAPLEHWNELDNRIIELMKTNFFYLNQSSYIGLHSSFCYWSYSYYDYSKNETLLEQLFESLKPFNFKENEVFLAYLDISNFELYNDKYQTGCWGKIVIEKFLNPNTPKDILKTIQEAYSGSLINILLLSFDKKLFEKKVLSKSLNYKTKGIPFMQCHFEYFEPLITIDFEKYNDIILNAFLNTNDPQNVIHMSYIIKENFPNGKEIIISHIKNIIDFVNKNQQEDYYSNPFILIQNLIEYEDIKEEIKPFSFSWFPKFKDLYTSDFEIFHEIYKEEAIPPLMEYWKNNEFPDKSIWTAILNLYDLKPFQSLMYDKLKEKTKYNIEICKILAKNGDSEIDFAIELGLGKSVELRKSGITLLSYINSPTSISKIENFLLKETNDDIRDLIFESVVEMNPQRNQNLTIEDVQKRIQNAEKLGKLKKIVRPWLEEKSIPKLFWNNGKELSENEVRYLFYRQSRCSEMLPDLEAKPMYELIDLSKSVDFGKKLWELYFQNSAQAKDKFILFPAAYFGGEEMVDLIMKQIKTWCDEGRGKMAENLTLALGAIKTKKALRAIDELSRKYKTKQKNVGASALIAFENAASMMNITTFELADKIIPNFDFENNYENLVIKGKNYRAFVDASFEMVFMDDNGKKIKKLPAGADKEIVDRFKLISKELKEALKFIKPRMEFYMVVQRRWPIFEWKELYLVNPVVFPFTLSTVWGLFENGVLKTTFTSLDDCSLVNVNYEPIEITDNQQIGIVHPLELKEETIEKWTTYMIDNKIEQSFAQLSRPIFPLTDEKKLCKFDTSYNAIYLNTNKLSRILDNLGWHKGSILDGGTISSYFKTFKNNNITAFVTFEGYITLGYYDDYENELTIGGIYFVPLGSVKVGNYSYDEPNNEKDQRLLTFESLPTIVYSEVMSDIQIFIEKAKLYEE